MNLKVYFFSVLSFLFFENLPAQTPGIQWQKNIGGSYGEEKGIMLKTKDGDIICVGVTGSSDGDLTTKTGFSDLMIARFSKDGVKKWVKSYGHIYGAAGKGAISQTSDGGFIVMSGPYIDKITASGDLIWETSYTRPGQLGGTAIYETPDKGYLFCTLGTRIGVIKLDSVGHLIREFYYGGKAQYTGDGALGMIRTIDGGFAIFGASNSYDGDFSAYNTYHEKAFLLKININGLKEWIVYDTTRTEGFNSVAQDSLGNYFCGGYGYFTEEYNGQDAVIEKLDVTGNRIWKKTFIGSTHEGINSVKLTKDHGIVFAGMSSSNDGDFSANVYTGRIWVGKLDQRDGSLAFQTFFGGKNNDFNEAYDIIQQDDEGLAVLCITDSLNPYLTSYKGGNSDLWLVRLGAVNTIRGTIFLDTNGNGIKDGAERTFDFGKVHISNDNQVNDNVLISSIDGNFIRDIDTGSYTSSFVSDNPYYATTGNVKHTVFKDYYHTDTLSFPVVPAPGKTDLKISLLALTAARAGFTMEYKLVYKNAGTEAVNNASIKFTGDSRLTLLGAFPPAVLSGNNTYTWNIPVINPLDTGSIIFSLRAAVPPLLNLGDILQSTAFITPLDKDLTPSDDTANLKQVVTGSFDPNDKTEANGGVITPAQINNGNYLQYLIRFQNTGTDTAFKISIRDTLDNRLDLSSFQMVDASHKYEMQLTEGNKINWMFNNIRLPDSIVNEPASHGYIAYRIKPKPTAAAGDTIHNLASIYFDFNLPVITNNAQTIVLSKLILPVKLSSFNATLHDRAIDVFWKTASEVNTKRFEVQKSSDGIGYVTIGNVQAAELSYGSSYLFQDETPASGYNYYRLKIIDLDGTFDYSGTAVVNLNREVSIISSVYPNPGNGQVTVQLLNTVPGNIQIQVLDQSGMEVLIKRVHGQHAGECKISLNLQRLSKGSYIIRVVTNNKVYMHKLLLQ